jgi:hypothetical protein
LDAIKLKILDGESVDYDFDTGNPVIISRAEQLMQSIYNEMKQNRGQWWHNTQLGVPYLNQPNQDGLFERRATNKSAFEVEFRRVMLNHRDEIHNYNITSSTINPKTRIFSCTISLNTIYGMLEVRF